jgi:glycerol-3-phosphate acyltransferase PlsY
MEYILAGLIAYLIGSVSFSVIFTKKFAGVDVRTKGSGNAGSTNVLRVAGKKAAGLTLLCDVLKGVVAVLIAVVIGKIFKSGDNVTAVLCQVAGLLVVIGHTFPVFFNFKGGKGVATSLGVLITINWRIGLICLVFALLIMALTKIVSLGSILAAVLFPILCIFVPWSFVIPGTHFSYVIFGLILALIVIFNHRSNIARLQKGTENKLDFSSKKKDK